MAILRLCEACLQKERVRRFGLSPPFVSQDLPSIPLDQSRRMTRSAGHDLFADMVSRPPDQVDLAFAALLIALEEYPGLDFSMYLARIDAFAERALSRLHFDASERPMEAIESINYELFETEGFRGNRDEYYDPRNSFLNEVLDRKTRDSHHVVDSLYGGGPARRTKDRRRGDAGAFPCQAQT